MHLVLQSLTQKAPMGQGWWTCNQRKPGNTATGSLIRDKMMASVTFLVSSCPPSTPSSRPGRYVAGFARTFWVDVVRGTLAPCFNSVRVRCLLCAVKFSDEIKGLKRLGVGKRAAKHQERAFVRLFRAAYRGRGPTQLGAD